MFAVMISVSLAITLGKSVPTCVFHRELFKKKKKKMYSIASKNLRSREGLVSWEVVSGESKEKTDAPGGRRVFPQVGCPPSHCPAAQ